MCRIDMPDDGAMLRDVQSWVGTDETLRQQVFVDNPASLYDFPRD